MNIFRKICNRYIGDRSFYRMVVTLAVPLVIQQGITSFVNLLDNVMVGGLGTNPISAVAIVNQLIFVFNLAIFGGMSGASIYGAQFAGNKDNDGLRYTLRFKLILGMCLCAVALLIFLLFDNTLIGLYLNRETSDPAAIAETLRLARAYLKIILWGLAPFMVSQAISSTLRETGETFAPMLTSILSIFTNLVLNYILIYGKLGAPALGVHGAAIATVISRYAEVGALILYVFVKRQKFPFLRGLLKSLRIPGGLVKKICITGAPLLLNETLWSTATALINQCYSVRGLTAVAAVNITSTATNLFFIVMFAMGNVISILAGQRLGANDIAGARAVVRKLIALDVAVHVAIGAVIIAISGAIPLIYNTEPEVRSLASRLLIIAGALLPLHACTHAFYFTIRSGGRTLLTFLLDSVYTCVIPLPVSFFLSRLTDIPVVTLFLIAQGCDVIKMCIGLPILIKGAWARNIIVEPEPGGTAAGETAAPEISKT